MSRLINCALFSFCLNRVCSKIFSVNALTSTFNYNFIRSLNMGNLGTPNYFLQSSLPNKSVMNPVAEVKIVPVLQDNFSYILKDPETSKVLCVDPAEPEKVYSIIKDSNLDLTHVLCTHKHWDHSGGNNQMKILVPGIHVVGSAYETTPGVNLRVQDNEIVNFGSLKIRCIKASCHTRGHMMYFVYSEKHNLQPILFTGDTLFVAGCGRFFEGSAKLMLDIVNKVKSLPPNTLLYCGHEYTVKNLQFAYTVDKSQAVVDKLNWAKDTVVSGGVTVPSLLSEEFTYNPFMRTKELMSNLNVSSEEDAMCKLREMKDRF